MTTASRVGLPWLAIVGSAVLLVALGAGGTYISLRSAGPSRSAEGGSAMPDSARPSEQATRTGSTEVTSDRSMPLPDVVVTLSQQAAARAGIVVSQVLAGHASGGLRAPGVVQPNAYRQVAVTPLVSGRVTSVAAELGQAVQRGQTIARIFSPELVEAQTRYVSARAELGAHEQALARTEKLVGIGAASRQELERIHAEHTARRADLEGAAAQLQLLGLSPAALDTLAPGHDQGATVDVPAPIAGIVTERTANAGLNVDQTTPLLTITDLSTVWVVVDLYEQDFSRVRVGSAASMTTRAYPGRVLEGKVSYIDPHVSPETRTARARIEVPNVRGDLRLGMYAEALFTEHAGDAIPMVPRGAVQHVGDRTVVYLVHAQEPGRFIEREVRLGAAAGDQIPVISGVTAGDVVVSEGSFSLRAERERLGLRTSAGMAGSPTGRADHAAMPGTEDVQEAGVTVSATSFEPSRLSLRAGVPARLTFTRISDTTCATAVVFASLNIRRDLPLNQPVTIEFTPAKAGEIAFACGMNMLRGTVVIN